MFTVGKNILAARKVFGETARAPSSLVGQGCGEWHGDKPLLWPLSPHWQGLLPSSAARMPGGLQGSPPLVSGCSWERALTRSDPAPWDRKSK